MNTFISFLRGINVSGHRSIRMPELKSVYETLGFVSVITYLQSGNILFGSAEDDRPRLTRIIEAKLLHHFGFSVPVILRDRDALRQMIDRNPFITRRNDDPSRLHVTFLSAVPNPADIPPVPAGTPDEFLLSGQDIYLFCPNGYGKTRLSNGFFERKMNLGATTRNWRTVLAVDSLASALRDLDESAR